MGFWLDLRRPTFLETGDDLCKRMIELWLKESGCGCSIYPETLPELMCAIHCFPYGRDGLAVYQAGCFSRHDTLGIYRASWGVSSLRGMGPFDSHE